MNLNKKILSIFKLLSINITVFLFLWIFIELAYYTMNPMTEKSNRVTCNYEWVLYNYCPNIVDVKVNTVADGASVVLSYTNEYGKRVGSSGVSNIETSKDVFVGDSFIQADEIPYADTFYGILEKRFHFNVLALGYSSWNIIQYKDAISKIAALNATYHVFIMPNDIIPKYHRSVLKERLNEKPKVRNVVIPSGFKVELSKIYRLSLAKQLVTGISSWKSPQKKHPPLISGDGFTVDTVTECQFLDQLNKEQRHSLGYDYLVYSKVPKCWSKEHINAAEQAVKELKSLTKVIHELNSKVIFYMVPPGWSFANQNTNGRKNNNYYFFDDAMEITTEPLTNYLRTALPNYEFISLEKLIKRKINQCGTCDNLFYFSDDGHWTATTHKLLSDYFSDKLNTRN